MHDLSRAIQDPVHKFFGIWLFDVHDEKVWKKRLFSLKMTLGDGRIGL